MALSKKSEAQGIAWLIPWPLLSLDWFLGIQLLSSCHTPSRSQSKCFESAEIHKVLSKLINPFQSPCTRCQGCLNPDQTSKWMNKPTRPLSLFFKLHEAQQIRRSSTSNAPLFCHFHIPVDPITVCFPMLIFYGNLAVVSFGWRSGRKKKGGGYNLRME